jgi:hypothetical protein
LGKEAWKAAEENNSTWATQMILMTRQLHQANQAFTNSARLPQLMAGNQILVGFYDDPSRINTFVDSSLHPEQVATAAVAAVQIPSTKAPAKTPEPAKLQSHRGLMDLGQFQPGQTRECEVEFTNTSAEPLKIAWIGLDRGCELVKMPRESIAPKGSGTITIKVLAPETPDLFERNINIHSNSPSPLIVKVQGRVGAANPAAKPTGASTKATANRR